MLLLIIKKEILQNLMSLRFGLACLVCFVALCLGSFVNTEQYCQDLADYRTNLAIHQHEVESYKHPWEILWQGAKVDLPLNVMTVFASRNRHQGVRTIHISCRGEPQPEKGGRTNPIGRLFPRIDLIFFIGIVMSLLALIFSYDAVSGEKEQGTLRLMLSYSVPRHTYLIGKWIGGLVSLTAPFTLAFMSSVVIILLFKDATLSVDNWLRLGILYIASLAYVSAVYSLGLFVSARTVRSATSAVAMLFAWVILVLIIPNIGPYLGSCISSSASFSVLERKKRDVQKEIWENNETEDRKYDKEHEIPRGIAWDSETMLNKRIYMTNILLRTVEAETRGYEKLNNEFLNQLDRQTMIGKHISRISPFSSFMYILLYVAGEDTQNERRVQKLLIEYKNELSEYGVMGQKRDLEQRLKGNENPAYSSEDCPRFQMPPLTFSYAMSAAGLDVLLLVIWNVLFFLWAYASFLRYDVR